MSLWSSSDRARGAAVLLAVMVASGCDRAPVADYVGGTACAECHAAEAEAWRGSDHDLAMQPATDATVLGDFEDATLGSGGATMRFFRRGADFFVRTDGPDGALADFRISYTFGVRPLQQYLVEFPDGRLQALGAAWDARPREEGGQRWFHLYAEDPPAAGDPLHWTGPAQNWNHMCAECHSTDVKKNYLPEEDRFRTRWSEINVSCEACHGAGSRHVEWARRRPAGAGPDGDPENLAFGRDPERGVWEMSESGTARRTVPRHARAEVEMCGRCHSRRTMHSEDVVPGGPLLDTHRVSLLEEGLYHADGQIRDEVYVYGSFRQSRMYAEGVTCTDCHDAHSGRTRAPGNALCAQCHHPDRFDTPAHHFHPTGSPGAQCVECHMPATTYMAVDPRRDHSLRIPRPDLSVALGVPNACNRCHADRSAAWAADAVAEWYGPDRRREPHWGEAIHAGRTWQAGAGARLREIARDGTVPAIARATALSLLSRDPSPGDLPVLAEGLRDPDPLVRRAALEALDAVDPETRLPLAAGLLADPVRLVRTEAARQLAAVPPDRLTAEQAERRAAGLAEYRAMQERNADRVEARLNLASLHRARGEMDRAEQELRRAIAVDSTFAPAWINRADLLREQGRDEEGERVLRAGLERVRPGEEAGLRHALGLLLVRRGRPAEAVEELRRAARIGDGVPRFAFVLAVALESRGDRPEALRVLEEANRKFPSDPEIASFLRQLRGHPGVDATRSGGKLEPSREDPSFTPPKESEEP